MAKRYAMLLCVLCNSTVSAVESVAMDYFNMLSQNYTGRPEGNKNIIHYYGALADDLRVFNIAGIHLHKKYYGGVLAEDHKYLLFIFSPIVLLQGVIARSTRLACVLLEKFIV
jgi:hypothetical protein